MGESIYGRGQIALLTGDLHDVYNITVNTTNNATQVHTIRKKGAGITPGVEETTVSYQSYISQDGQERDYFALVKTAAIVRLRIKIDGETMTIEGAYKTRDFTLPLDAAIELNMEFVGHLVT